MALKKISDFKKDDYTYTGLDGDEYEITIIQSPDRQYVEIKKNATEQSEKVQVCWDVSMLLELAGAVQSVIQNNNSELAKPRIRDLRDNRSQAEKIQEVVDESMKKLDSTEVVVDSMEQLQKEIEQRKAKVGL